MRPGRAVRRAAVRCRCAVSVRAPATGCGRNWRRGHAPCLRPRSLPQTCALSTTGSLLLFSRMRSHAPVGSSLRSWPRSCLRTLRSKGDGRASDHDCPHGHDCARGRSRPCPRPRRVRARDRVLAFAARSFIYQIT